MKELKEECNHQFWKDRNPPGCLSCGKTEEELWADKIETEKRKYAKEIVGKIDILIAEEMLICHKENQPTSRLTSLSSKISDLLKELKI